MKEFPTRHETGPENQQRFRPWEERTENGESPEQARERRLNEEQDALAKSLEDLKRT